MTLSDRIRRAQIALAEKLLDRATTDPWDEGFFAFIMVFWAEPVDTVLRYRANDRNIDRFFLLFVAEALDG